MICEIDAVKARHRRTKQQVLVLTAVLLSYLNYKTLIKSYISFILSLSLQLVLAP